jgi:hypothetical protein
LLQIIGFLGCLYLFLKGFELLGRAARYSPPLRGVKLRDLPDEERKHVEWEWRGYSQTRAAGIIAIAGSVLFTLLLIGQGNEVSSSLSASGGLADCISHATTVEQINACH